MLIQDWIVVHSYPISWLLNWDHWSKCHLRTQVSNYYITKRHAVPFIDRAVNSFRNSSASFLVFKVPAFPWYLPFFPPPLPWRRVAILSMATKPVIRTACRLNSNLVPRAPMEIVVSNWYSLKHGIHHLGKPFWKDSRQSKVAINCKQWLRWFYTAVIF